MIIQGETFPFPMAFNFTGIGAIFGAIGAAAGAAWTLPKLNARRLQMLEEKEGLYQKKVLDRLVEDRDNLVKLQLDFSLLQQEVRYLREDIRSGRWPRDPDQTPIPPAPPGD